MLLDVQENTLAQAAKPIDKHKNKKPRRKCGVAFYENTN